MLYEQKNYQKMETLKNKTENRNKEGNKSRNIKIKINK